MRHVPQCVKPRQSRFYLTAFVEVKRSPRFTMNDQSDFLVDEYHRFRSPLWVFLEQPAFRLGGHALHRVHKTAAFNQSSLILPHQYPYARLRCALRDPH